jgi:endonuclease/exonuclease/phosphatase (EEP) superfamily protein YafD
VFEGYTSKLDRFQFHRFIQGGQTIEDGLQDVNTRMCRDDRVEIMAMKAKKPSKRSLLLSVCAVGLGLGTLLSHLGDQHWLLELASHFRVQLFQLCLIPLGAALWFREMRFILIFLLLAGLNYATILPLYFGKAKADPEDSPPVRAMLMNLNASNGHTEKVLLAIDQYNPDILLLLEVTPHWAEELKPLEKRFPHQMARPQSDCFGILLMSRHPLENRRIANLGGSGFPSLLADVYVGKQTFSFLGTHPVPPVGAANAALRNRQLLNLEPLVAELRFPVVLMGDLNTTSWSPHFARLEATTQLRNSQKGFGVQPTWPSGSRLAKIPIDHLLHSPSIKVLNRMVGPDVGSDHRPVIVDFVIK